MFDGSWHQHVSEGPPKHDSKTLRLFWPMRLLSCTKLIYIMDRGKLTPEERDLMVSFAVTIQGWSTQRTSMIHLKESEMCRFDQYFSGTFSFARCRSGSACLWWFQRCAAGKSSEWIKSSPSILEVLPPFSRAICWISHCSLYEVPAVGQYASAKVWMDTQRTLFSIGNARELLLRCWM